MGPAGLCRKRWREKKEPANSQAAKAHALSLIKPATASQRHPYHWREREYGRYGKGEQVHKQRPRDAKAELEARLIPLTCTAEEASGQCSESGSLICTREKETGKNT